MGGWGEEVGPDGSTGLDGLQGVEPDRRLGARSGSSYGARGPDGEPDMGLRDQTDPYLISHNRNIHICKHGIDRSIS